MLLIAKQITHRLCLGSPNSQKTVHEFLFSKQATLKGRLADFNIGIVPYQVLEHLLPKCVTKECLVQLQYCQEISRKDVHAFPSISTLPASSDQSFLFFPALCTASSDIKWVISSDLCYSIGWLARCNSINSFSPRFHHVLLLRLVLRFTLMSELSAQTESASSDHSLYKHLCDMWKTGVHWVMEEGLECVVELVNANKEIVVFARGKEDAMENIATIFNQVVSCVMEAKEEFCHSIKPEYFIFDPLDKYVHPSDNNLFSLRSVEKFLISPEGKKILVSINMKSTMEIKKLLIFRKFTHWSTIFPISLVGVLNYIKVLATELVYLGDSLIPQDINTIEANCRQDAGRMRRELVKSWLSSSQESPCWWHLVQALEEVDRSALAKQIKEDHSKWP